MQQNTEHGQRIQFLDNWGGGRFSVDLKVGDKISLVTNETHPINCVLSSVIKRPGTDHDHGHTEHWVFQDYAVQFPGDTIERRTSLRDLLTLEKLRAYTGHTTCDDLMYFYASARTWSELIRNRVRLRRDMQDLVATACEVCKFPIVTSIAFSYPVRDAMSNEYRWQVLVNGSVVGLINCDPASLANDVAVRETKTITLPTNGGV